MKRTKSRRRNFLLLAAFLTAALVLGLLIFGKYRESRQLPVAKPEPKPTGTIQLTLFFAAPEGDGLAREGRVTGPCADLAECVAEAVAELVNGPVGDLQPSLPPSTIVHGVRIDGDTAVIDFGHELVEGLPGGSSSEMTAVYSVVDTVCFNFPQLKRVKFLIDGKETDTLAGHLDLRQPLGPDYSLESAAAPAPASPPTDAPAPPHS
ncbi:sporulation protein [Geotalea uraniireducens]|uniref:Sporulation protein n=1 Tax=Geotalea uraniireducens TaxID=351604 RepID=A0ABN6VWZ8_9BACT|nr:GerMN domain-containing protein [Geotalea uraniireducens]BDV44342.1 sporulation protein [Geotalea uraniireducens]